MSGKLGKSPLVIQHREKNAVMPLQVIVIRISVHAVTHKTQPLIQPYGTLIERKACQAPNKRGISVLLSCFPPDVGVQEYTREEEYSISRAREEKRPEIR
jgi:hypothetical protein